MNAPAAVLFDLDGTLIDTAPDMAGAVNDMLTSRERPELPFAPLRTRVSHGSRALVDFAFEPQNEDDTQRYIREFLAVYEQRVSRSSNLFEGMAPFLATLEARGVHWGVVTNKPGGLSHSLLTDLRLLERMGVHIAGDTLAQRKPHPMPLLHAAKHIGVPANRCIYVGDAERDIVAGRSAGMTTIAAGYGYILEDDCASRWGADFLVDSVAQLHQQVDRLLAA
ncbi:MAG: phosphoglycolate phosphatase [Gammaproteobacteria bacterium]